MAYKPLLTIAIPTYNRSLYLAQLLTVLTPQLFQESRVELIISDNASTDDTQFMIATFQRDGLICRYLKNESNLGPDGNILRCFEEANGKYVWVFGDDDIMVPGTIEKIRKLLEVNEYTMIYVQPHGCTREEQLINIHHLEKDPVVYTCATEYARKVNNMLTFISSNIINKDALTAMGNIDFKAGIGTHLVQMSWTYAALNNFKSALFIPQVTVLSLSNNSGGFGICKVMGENLSMMARKLIKSKRIVQILESATLRECLPYYIVKMKESSYTLYPESAHEILFKHFKNNISYWIFVYPIIQLPLMYARKWLLACRLLIKINKALQLLVTQRGRLPTIN